MSKALTAIVVAGAAGAVLVALDRKQRTQLVTRTRYEVKEGRKDRSGLIDAAFGIFDALPIGGGQNKGEGILSGLFKRRNTGGNPQQQTPPQQPQTGGTGQIYNRSGIGPDGVDFDAYERKYNLPAGYLKRTGQIESNLNPNAKNPRSSAGGLFQFIDATARDYGLKNRYDAHEATDAAARLAKDNADRLRGVLGRDATAAELYLAHQQGGGGASKLLRNRNAPANSVVSSQAVRLNGGNTNMTAGQFANLWIDKFNRGFN